MTDEQVIEVTPHECWIASLAERGETSFAVTHPYDGTEIATVWEPGPAQLDRAFEGVRAQPELTVDSRAATLHRLADSLAARADEAAELLTAESGAPITAAEGEVTRSVAALRAATRETGGRASAIHAPLPAWVRWRPRGPVLATTGDAHPLEYAARAVAAAVAAGAPVVLVPAPETPLSSLLLGELLAETELPPGWFSVLPAPYPLPLADAGMVRATYGAESAGTLLLCPDWCAEPDLEFAAEAAATGCDRRAAAPGTATTRVLVDESCLERLLPWLRASFGARTVGSPHDPSVAIGPLRHDRDADIVTERIDAAIDAGYRMATGGGRDAACLEPTVLAAPAVGLGPWYEEIPGPVVLVAPVRGLAEALSAADDLGRDRPVSLLTHDVRTVATASERLHAGLVTVGALAPTAWDARAAVRELTRETATLFPEG